jgi:hypothetical protein
VTPDGTTCDQVSNLTQLGSATFNLDGQTFTIVDNFISPTSAGIMINGKQYTLSDGSTVSIGIVGGVNYTATLKSISYNVPIMHTVAVEICGTSQLNGGGGGAGNGTVAMHVYPNGTISVVSTVVNDTVVLLSDNKTVDTGRGSLSYNGMALLPGSYTVQGKDTVSGSSSQTAAFARPKYAAQLAFTSKCPNQTVASNAFSCTTAAQVTSTGNQLNATLYVNGAKVGTTTTSISSTEAVPGTYAYTFSTAGNSNYAAGSINYTYKASAVANNSANATRTKLASKSTLPGALVPAVAIAVIGIITAVAYAGYRRRRRAQTPPAQ